MAHSKSARKRIRQNTTRRLRNRRRKATLKEALHEFDSALAGGDPQKAGEKLRAASQQLDRVASKGAIHKKTAARKKSRLARRLNAAAK